MQHRINKIANKISNDVISAVILPDDNAFRKYLEDHPDYREDTEFIVNGTKRQAPAKQKKNDKQISEEELKNLAFEKGDKISLQSLASHPDRKVRFSVAYHKNTSAEILDKLANDEDEGVRETVARNENTSAETLDKLADDECVLVRRVVPFHKNTSVKALEKLANDEDYWVRREAKFHFILKH